MKSYIKIVENPDRILKTYSSISLIANIMIALSFVGFSVLGVQEFETKYFVLAMMGFSVLGFIGRFIKEDIDNIICESNKLIIRPGIVNRLQEYISKQLNKLRR